MLWYEVRYELSNGRISTRIFNYSPQAKHFVANQLEGEWYQIVRVTEHEANVIQEK